MKTLYCLGPVLFAAFFLAGCGESNPQAWENGKGRSSAEKSATNNDDVVNNDTPGEGNSEAAHPHRSVNPHTDNPHVENPHAENPHAAANPHGEMFGAGEMTGPTPPNDGKLDLRQLHWTVPKEWVRKTPGMMVAAEYSVPHGEGDKENVRFTVSQAGGSVKANLDRWKNQQFTQLDKQNQESLDVSGCKITLVDLSGTFVGMSMGAAAEPKEGYRMIGAIVEVPGQDQMTFVKCYGPAKTMAAHADEVKAFIKSMKVDK